MGKCKKDFVRVCADIPAQDHNIIKEHNENSTRPVIISRIITEAIHEIALKIQKEDYFGDKPYKIEGNFESKDNRRKRTRK